jgi:hypothetical protein
MWLLEILFQSCAAVETGTAPRMPRRNSPGMSLSGPPKDFSEARRVAAFTVIGSLTRRAGAAGPPQLTFSGRQRGSLVEHYGPSSRFLHGASPCFRGNRLEPCRPGLDLMVAITALVI